MAENEMAYQDPKLLELYNEYIKAEAHYVSLLPKPSPRKLGEPPGVISFSPKDIEQLRAADAERRRWRAMVDEYCKQRGYPPLS